MNIGENVRDRKSDAKYTHGEVFFGNAWPTDVDPWKLSKTEHIPRLFFDDDIPACPELGQVTDWLFAVTDYCEETMATTAVALPNIFFQIDTQFQVVSGGQVVDLIKKREYPVSTDPFHRPGQRCLGIMRMPNLYNGFSVPVVMKGANAKS